MLLSLLGVDCGKPGSSKLAVANAVSQQDEGIVFFNDITSRS